MPIVLKSASLNLLEPSGPVQACNWIALPFTIRITWPTHLIILDLITLIVCGAHLDGRAVQGVGLQRLDCWIAVADLVEGMGMLCTVQAAASATSRSLFHRSLNACVLACVYV